MNFLKKFNFNFNFNLMDNYYINIYNDILNNCDMDYNILFINHNYFNPLNHFSHIIKRYNLNIYIIYNDKESIERINEEIKEEECSENIHYNFTNLDDMSIINNKINFNRIIVLHLNSLNYLNNNLDLISRFYNNNFELNFFVSLSSNEDKYSDNKNTIRSLVKNNLNYNLGRDFDFDIFLKNLNSNKFFKVKKIKIFKESNYVVYGKSNIYKIILNKL